MFLEELNGEFNQRHNIEMLAGWDYGSNITDYNEQRKEKVQAEAAEFYKVRTCDSNILILFFEELFRRNDLCMFASLFDIDSANTVHIIFDLIIIIVRPGQSKCVQVETRFSGILCWDVNKYWFCIEWTNRYETSWTCARYI